MRDTSFSICKAIAIIFVVLSHAGAPAWINHWIFQFHVPIFFICAGYFFNVKYLDDEKTFIAHRVKGLYIPFVKWSLVLLCLHNLLYPLGILSETYGNAAGGVLHPYSWHDFSQRLWSILFNMSGYDEFLGGSFWFFRALLVSSLLFLILFKVFRYLRIARSDAEIAWLIMGCALIFALWQVLGGLRVTGLAQGGYRELMGLYLMSAGFIYKENRKRMPLNIITFLICLGVTALGARYFPSSMGYRADFSQFVSFLLPSVAGFFVIYYLSVLLDRAGGFVKKGLAYIGDHTLYIFAFHLFAFKIVSAIKVWTYDLPWQQIGCHTVIHAYPNDGFCWLYLFVGVSVPLLVRHIYLHAASKFDLSLKNCARLAFKWLLLSLIFLARGIKWLVRTLYAGGKGFVKGIREIIQASNPKDE